MPTWIVSIMLLLLLALCVAGYILMYIISRRNKQKSKGTRDSVFLLESEKEKPKEESEK